MRVRWFGESWGAPICDARYQIEPPNVKCMGCDQQIFEVQRGVATAFVGDAAERMLDYVFEVATGPNATIIADAVAYHVDCFVFGLVGEEAAAPDRLNPSAQPETGRVEVLQGHRPQLEREAPTPPASPPKLALNEPGYDFGSGAFAGQATHRLGCPAIINPNAPCTCDQSEAPDATDD